MLAGHEGNHAECHGQQGRCSAGFVRHEKHSMGAQQLEFAKIGVHALHLVKLGANQP
jgi:hypothetical protein